MEIISLIVSLGSLVCWIMVLIKMFPAEGVLKGILGIICGLYPFIWGWINKDRYNLKNVMIAWSILMVISIVTSVMVQSAT